MIHASIGPSFSIAGSTISRTLAITFSSDQVQQRLMLGRRPRWRRPRRHRLDALAFARQHQSGAIIAQRTRPVRMTNNARKPLNIRRKPCFAVVAVLEIHLALHVPKSESLQLFDSQPRRLRPSDSVRLTQLHGLSKS